MHTLDTLIEIEAPAERVWSILTDFPSHCRWNPFIRSVEGELAAGKTLKVFIQPQGQKGIRFKPKLIAVRPSRELRWKGKVLLAGIFDGEHYFMIEEKPDGGVRFRQGEIFTGILVPLFKRALDGPTRDGFIAMNEALKREAERG